jgi:hypothetical protein
MNRMCSIEIFARGLTISTGGFMYTLSCDEIVRTAWSKVQPCNSLINASAGQMILNVHATNRELESCPDYSTLKTADVARLAPFGGALQFMCNIDFLQENALLLVAAMA